jgi:hypothetical protein
MRHGSHDAKQVTLSATCNRKYRCVLRRGKRRGRRLRGQGKGQGEGEGEGEGKERECEREREALVESGKYLETSKEPGGARERYPHGRSKATATLPQHNRRTSTDALARESSQSSHMPWASKRERGSQPTGAPTREGVGRLLQRGSRPTSAPTQQPSQLNLSTRSYTRATATATPYTSHRLKQGGKNRKNTGADRRVLVSCEGSQPWSQSS